VEATVFRSSIGVAMRIYRRSPLYPWCGKYLARLLLALTRPRGSVVREVNGIKYDLDLRQMIDSSLYYSGSIEPHAERTIASIVKPGMIAIDVGANIGCHTFPLARLVGPEGQVLAVEPTSAAFAKLQRNLSLNSFSNIKLIRAGLTDQDLGLAETNFTSSYRLDRQDQMPPRSRECFRSTRWYGRSRCRELILSKSIPTATR
jgi:hypothetical protein